MLDFFNSLEQSRLSIWVRESGSIWSFPTILLLHTLGMSIVAGGSAIIDLVLLGFWPAKTPIRPLDKYFPLIWGGFWLNAATGTLLLMADATAKLTNPDFYVKMAFILAGVIVLYQMRKKVFGDPLLDERVISGTAKGLAWASLICWFAAITAGRLLAYVGPVSGPPGLSNR
ncbi:MAG TPA: hypothetical protein VHZ74_02030 [Bryobacteraceae bacterium]|jgi:hypothetical protein|nr:hypothetical protein [Bryobacteraceae bacterium]